MSKIKVRQVHHWGFSVGNDWVVECAEHDISVWTFSWENAYETAVGHAAMRHPRRWSLDFFDPWLEWD